MRNYLLRIKAVPGVRACAVLDTGRREMHPLFPANASPKFIERLAERLIHMAEQMEPREQVEFQFDKQVCIVRRLVRGLIFVQTRPTAEIKILNLTLGSVSSAVDRLLKTSKSTRSLSYDYTKPEYLDAVLRAFGESSDYFKGHVGNFVLTKHLQRTRDNIISVFPLLANFAVDQNGRVYPIKGKNPSLNSSANEAFSRWLHSYLNAIWVNHPKRNEFNLRELTSDVAQTLEDSNFYGSLAELQ